MTVPIILFVDDEPNILKTLQRLFFDEEYELYTAGSGQKALDLINNNLTPTVIVSDQRMPGMSGAEFLAQAREKVPDSIRMVLTGYADISAAVDAINLGGVYRYIVKPWNDNDLKLAVSDGIHRYNLVNENRQLTAELQQANLDLANMNKDLDEVVKIRTRELRQKVKELQGRDDIQQLLMTVQPMSDLLQVVLGVIIDVSCAEGGAFLLLDGDDCTDFFLFQKVSFYEGTLVDKQSEVETKAMECLSEQGGECKACEYTFGLSQVCLLPLVKGNIKYGVLAIKSPENEVFSEDEMNTFAGFAGQAVIGISDSQVHDNLDDIGSSLDDMLNDLQLD